MLFQILNTPINSLLLLLLQFSMLSFLCWIFAPIEANMPVDQDNSEHNNDIIMYDSNTFLEWVYNENVDAPNIETIIVIVDTESDNGARCFHTLSDQVALSVWKNMIDKTMEAIPKAKYTKQSVKFVIIKSDLCLLLQLLLSFVVVIISLSFFIIIWNK